MTLPELLEVLGRLKLRTQGDWTPSAEGMLTLLAELAARDQGRELSEAYRMFVEMLPDAEPMLMHCLPVILMAKHPRLAPYVACPSYAKMDEFRPYWMAELQTAVMDPMEFTKLIDKISQELAHLP
jgi:hypothetical protein